VTLRLCNITAKLPSEGLCSLPPKGARLRNPDLELRAFNSPNHRLNIHYKTVWFTKCSII